MPLSPSALGGLVRITSDVSMPLWGVGTWTVQDSKILHDVIDRAFSLGCRFVDTALAYKNHEMIAGVLKELLPKHKLRREDIFITSKIPPGEMGNEKTLAAIERTLLELDTPYIDLMLIHWPKGDRHGSWMAMQKMMNEGKLRAIGVSNYEVEHLEEMLKSDEYTIKPAVNQCELHPHYPNSTVFNYCRTHNIHMQAYSSLGSHVGANALFNDKLIKSLSATHSCTPAQLLFAYALCQGISVLPRTTNVDRVKENADSVNVKLSDDEIKQLTALGEKSEKKYCWDPR